MLTVRGPGQGLGPDGLVVPRGWWLLVTPLLLGVVSGHNVHDLTTATQAFHVAECVPSIGGVLPPFTRPAMTETISDDNVIY